MTKLTILTDIIPYSPESLIYLVARKIKRIFHGPKVLLKYGGHFSVTRSLIEGLEKIGAKYNYNPKNLQDLNPTVVVLSGLYVLKQAIKLKKKGLIKKIIAGPNIINSPAEDKIFKFLEIDICITPSEWICNYYEQEEPLLKGKCRPWPAGVDENFWIPAENKPDSKNILFYAKRPVKEMFDECKKIANQYGFNVEIIYHFKFDQPQFRAALQRNAFLVCFVEQESQGIVLTEAWSTNTPTFVWNPGFYHYKGKNYKASSAPYLSKETGRFFRDEQDFQLLIENNSFDTKLFNPRKWVLDNMTDAKSAQLLLNIAINNNKK